MKITALQTISLEAFPNVFWVEVETDEGLTGLGETFFGTRALHAYTHESIAPILLGQDPGAIDAISKKLLNPYIGFKSTGVEIRSASAIDIALWDILGQGTGVPIWQLLGGKSRDKIRVYNTCAGYDYVKTTTRVETDNWGVGQAAPGPYEDLEAFMSRADELAHSLIEEGYHGMKIWPFDPAAEEMGGMDITVEQLKKGMEPFEKVRAAVGDKINLHVELHGLWFTPAAVKIARALEAIDPYWLEDPIKMTNLDALASYKRQVRPWVAASEVLSGRVAFRELFERQACDVCILDIGWSGGLSEAKKISTMAEAYELPIAPHDCTGPVLLNTAVHLSANLPNTLIQEVVRAFYHGWYKDMVTELPVMKDGYIWPTTGPGLGMALVPDVKKRQDVQIQRSEL